MRRPICPAPWCFSGGGVSPLVGTAMVRASGLVRALLTPMNLSLERQDRKAIVVSFLCGRDEEGIANLGGQLVRKIWQYDPTLYAPAKYRRACSYETFVPDLLAALTVSLPGEVAGIISEAERAISDLNQAMGVPLGPLARLLLRTESIASSKVEWMQVDARSLARAEASLDI